MSPIDASDAIDGAYRAGFHDGAKHEAERQRHRWSHTCQLEECGWTCEWVAGIPTRDISVEGVDGEGRCDCVGHD